ncbi:MAG: hypothetical protein QM698_13615 [Micropepsaceae bacterium]
MKNPRFWRDLFIMLAIAGSAAIAIAIAMDDAGEDSSLQIGLMIGGMMVAPISAIAGIYLYASVRSFERLDRGENLLGRWDIQPEIWRRFAELDRGLTAALQPEWRNNPIDVPATIDAPVEIVVSTEALRVGDAYFGAGKADLRLARFLDGSPQAIELFYYYPPTAKTSARHFCMRFPVAPEAEAQGRAVVDWYAVPVPLGPVARILSAPARAADRNPRKARNIALVVAAIGAALGGFLIANADKPWVKDAMNSDDAGAVLVILPAVAGPIVAIAALILALVWHLRARNGG